MLGPASSSFAPSSKEGEPGMRPPAWARKRLATLAALASTICRCCSAAWLRSRARRRLIARPKLSAVRNAGAPSG